jgi:hypothetical protein
MLILSLALDRVPARALVRARVPDIPSQEALAFVVWLEVRPPTNVYNDG